MCTVQLIMYRIYTDFKVNIRKIFVINLYLFEVNEKLVYPMEILSGKSYMGKSMEIKKKTFFSNF